jgi:hypothetical protein
VLLPKDLCCVSAPACISWLFLFPCVIRIWASLFSTTADWLV